MAEHGQKFNERCAGRISPARYHQRRAAGNQRISVSAVAACLWPDLLARGQALRRAEQCARVSTVKTTPRSAGPCLAGRAVALFDYAGVTRRGELVKDLYPSP